MEIRQDNNTDNLAVDLTLSEADWLDSPYHRARVPMDGAVHVAHMARLAFALESDRPHAVEKPAVEAALANDGVFADHIQAVCFDAAVAQLAESRDGASDGAERHDITVGLTPRQLRWVGQAAWVSYQSGREILLDADPLPGFLSNLRLALLLNEEDLPAAQALWSATEETPENTARIDEKVSADFQAGLQRLQTVAGVLDAVSRHFGAAPPYDLRG